MSWIDSILIISGKRIRECEIQKLFSIVLSEAKVKIREGAKTWNYDAKTLTARIVAEMVAILLWNCRLS